MPTDISVRNFWPSDLHDEAGFSVVFCSSCFTWTIVSHMWCCILANNPFLNRDCFSKLIPFHRDATFAGLSHFLCTPKCRMFLTVCTAYWAASAGSFTWFSPCLPQCKYIVSSVLRIPRDFVGISHSVFKALPLAFRRDEIQCELLCNYGSMNPG